MQRSMIITREETRGLAVSEAPALCFPVPIVLSLSHQYRHSVPIGQVSTRTVNQGNNEACATGEPFKCYYNWGLNSVSFNFLVFKFSGLGFFFAPQRYYEDKIKNAFQFIISCWLISSPELFVFLVYELDKVSSYPQPNQGKAVTYTQQTLNGSF